MSDGVTGVVSDLAKDFVQEGKTQITSFTKPSPSQPQTQQGIPDPAALMAAALPKEEKNIFLQKQILNEAIARQQMKRDQLEMEHKQTVVTSQSMPETDLQISQAGGMSTDKMLQVTGKRSEMKGNKSGE